MGLQESVNGKLTKINKNEILEKAAVYNKEMNSAKIEFQNQVRLSISDASETRLTT